MTISPLFPQQTKLMKAIEVAEVLNISRAMAYRLMQTGELRTVSIGTAKRVRRQDLLTYIENNISPQMGT
jgi:excisionase family DNA binding protein